MAAAFEAALLRPVSGAHVFNLRGSLTTIDQVVADIRRLVPSASISAEGDVPPIAAELEPHDVEAVLGPLPKTELADGLRQTIEFYRRQSDGAKL